MPPFCHTMPVRFSDIDHAGIVYFARFFHFAHVALEEYFSARVGGRAYADLLDRERIGFPSVQTECRFMAPLRFGDVMDVELEIARLGTSSIHFNFRVYRGAPPGPSEYALERASGQAPEQQPDTASEPSERVLCAEGRYITAVVDLDRFRAVPIPDRLRDILSPLVLE